MLNPADELPHPAPDPIPERWQENYFVLAHDRSRDAAFVLHLERFPDRGIVETKVTVVLGDRLVSATTHAPLTEAPGTDATQIHVVEPFHRWRVTHDGTGTLGRGPFGFVGEGFGPDAAVGFEVELDSPLGAIDHAEVLSALSFPGTERDHYEACGTWHGTLRAGDERIEAEGLFVRDHTWGERQYARLSSAWWFPSCFDDGGTYLGGVVVRSESRTGGYAILADRGGVEATMDVELTATGVLAPQGYPTTTLVATFPERGVVTVDSTTRVHLPHHFPGFAPGYYTNDALSSLAWDDRSGFGPRELNSYLTSAEARMLARVVIDDP